jgi:hypothetical protein
MVPGDPAALLIEVDVMSRATLLRCAPAHAGLLDATAWEAVTS